MCAGLIHQPISFFGEPDAGKKKQKTGAKLFILQFPTIFAHQ
jgi:hypothetical protein